MSRSQSIDLASEDFAMQSPRRLLKLIANGLVIFTCCVVASAQNQTAPAQTIATLPASILDRELTTIDQRHLKLSDYSDRIIVLTLFASWCGPCRMNLADLIDLKQNYKTHPIEVLGLVSKKNDADLDEVRNFARVQGINFAVIWDTEDFDQLLVKLGSDRQVLPQTFVIDKSGNIRRDFLGHNREMTPKLLCETMDQIGSEPDKPKNSP